MKHQRSSCKHTTAEELNICVEATCIQKKEYKLDCLRCLQSEHRHHECILHISHIVNDAQVNQQQFVKLIREYLQFSTNLKEKQIQIIESIRTQINRWLDNQKNFSIQQIEFYEKELQNQQNQIESVTLDRENIKDVIDFMHFNDKEFISKNKELQLILIHNQTSMNKYLDNYYERLTSYYECSEITEQELPKIETKFRVEKIINHQECAEVGCTQQEKIKLCLDESCLKMEKLELECPSCQVVRHREEKTFESHQKSLQKSCDIWELQNKYIDDVEEYCEQQSQTTRSDSQELQDKIDECQKLNELKLYQFKLFVQEKEQEILGTLKKFKSQFQKDYFVIYRDLLLQIDFSILSGVDVKLAKFQNITESFTSQYKQEENLTVDQYLDLWSKGLCYIQQHKVLQEGDNLLNKSSQQIVELKEEINVRSSQYKHTIEQLNEELKQVSKSNNLTQQFIKEIEAIEQEINQQIQEILKSILNAQDYKISQLEQQKDKAQFPIKQKILEQINTIKEERKKYVEEFTQLQEFVKSRLQNLQLVVNRQ